VVIVGPLSVSVHCVFLALIFYFIHTKKNLNR